ncbi:MAG: VWA domain-containing protein, partial [Balneolaceae bacterium]
VQRQGVNLLVALDLSQSMNAEDVRPSRLSKAKFEITRLIERLRGDRVGLLVFTGDAFIQSPMTMDYSALRMFLDIAETNQMPSGTTNFQAAFEKAAEAFESLENQAGNDAANVLLFIADGENHGPSYNEDLRRLINKGVMVFTVGIGTREGGPIPIYESGTSNLIGYVRDSNGNLVNTRLETGTMQEIARQSGGNYYEINSATDTIEPFFAKLDELEKGEFSSQEFADFQNQYQIILLAGIIFFIAGLLMPAYRKSEKSFINFFVRN